MLRKSLAALLIGALSTWLLTAAEAPADKAPRAPLGKYTAAERRHWSFQPRTTPAIPAFTTPADKAWAKSGIDAFVLARLKKESLTHAPEADRATLIRRVTFNLTGLPPTPAEVAGFLADKSPNAWTTVIDRLLASPHYGERWGQHWLDVVRFSETEGFEYDNLRPDAWRYRDYVIRAFNNDKPWDRFIREQLAGDEIAPDEDETLIAAGFNRLGPIRRNAGNQAVASSRNETLTEMTNIVGAGFMGVTLGCARCHDHKFDGFRQSDYYRVQAFFSALQPSDLTKATAQEQADWKAKAAPFQAEVATLNKEIVRRKNANLSLVDPDGVHLEAKFNAAQEKVPAALPALFTVKNDPTQKAPINLLPRGDYEHPGDSVGMRVPGVFLPEGAPEVDENIQKPREYLANWLTDAKNPLTARVMVNRIWHYHFGRGIVGTPNDFGRMGERPLNPELLDYLATEFIASGYSVKHMHRLILTSNTWRQSSVAPQAAITKDPDGRFLTRFPRARLEAEEIRDSMLHVSGLLNPKQGGPGVMTPIDKVLIDSLYTPSQWKPAKDPAEYTRRTIYLIAKRNLELPFMQAFDAPDNTVSCPRRESSTHAPQALEMLNGELPNQAAAAFSARLLKEAGPDHRKQIDLAYQLTAGRAPKPTELKLALDYLAKGEEAKSREQFALAMFNLNAFLYVN